MYQPLHHREERLEVQHQLIRAHPLAILVTFGANGLVANPIPFILAADASPLGTLKGHLARANPQWRQFDARQDVLAIFQGVNHYISPSWYATKRETGKVVPTWNYTTVHAYGPLRIRDDRDWLAGQIAELTRQQEARRPEPWAVSDAPEDFIEAQIKGIVGLEIPISRIEGKWKVSQNRPEADRKRVVEGLRSETDPASRDMADLVASRGKEPS